MKIPAPILPVLLILCVAMAFVTFKTFQLQSQINVLFAMNNSDIHETKEAMSSPPTPTVVVMHATDATPPPPATKITVEEELVKEVEAINEEEKEAQELRCQLRAQNSTCKGSVKEMKRKTKAAAATVSVTTETSS